MNHRLTNSEFNRLSSFITCNYGIKLPEKKKILLENRLQKRLRELDINSFGEYIEHVFSDPGLQNELVHMIDSILTNKTSFFREKQQFEFLKDEVLPSIYKNKSKNDEFRIWSAGCSSGEEAYTLAFLLSEFKSNNSDFNFLITATDISTRMLKTAKKAVYPEKLVIDVPVHMKQKYLLKSKDRHKKSVRIAPELRNIIHFEQHNLIEKEYSAFDSFDVIFCRNVLIYFEKQTQHEVLDRFTEKLRKNGYLFLGLSESLASFNLPYKLAMPSVYIKTATKSTHKAL